MRNLLLERTPTEACTAANIAITKIAQWEHIAESKQASDASGQDSKDSKGNELSGYALKALVGALIGGVLGGAGGAYVPPVESPGMTDDDRKSKRRKQVLKPALAGTLLGALTTGGLPMGKDMLTGNYRWLPELGYKYQDGRPSITEGVKRVGRNINTIVGPILGHMVLGPWGIPIGLGLGGLRDSYNELKELGDE